MLAQQQEQEFAAFKGLSDSVQPDMAGEHLGRVGRQKHLIVEPQNRGQHSFDGLGDVLVFVHIADEESLHFRPIQRLLLAMSSAALDPPSGAATALGGPGSTQRRGVLLDDDCASRQYCSGSTEKTTKP